MASSRSFRSCSCCLGMGRRQFLASAAALGAFVAVGVAPTARAQAKPHRIDVHHHVSPPAWVDALKKAKLDSPPVNSWTPQRSIEDMDKGAVATSILSVTQPAVQFVERDKDEARRIARESNEYMKKLVGDFPGRFGMFAMLPLTDTDGSLKEIEYALDTLHADGIGLMTSYGDKWLGYAEFDPVWQELNRRKATVYTHPTGPNCCVNLVQGIGEATVEYAADTTRSIASLIFTGTSQRYKDSSGSSRMAAVC
jgi:6-methylsalicylate decarboxylase